MQFDPNKKVAGEIDAPVLTPEEAERRYGQLCNNIDFLMGKLAAIEERAICTPLTVTAAQNLFKDAKAISEPLQWLQTIKRNRYDMPAAQAKLKAEEEAKKNQMITAPDGSKPELKVAE